ncbi:hypothetical protein ACH4PU_30875 [Streptomyces sp. NPDC021100]|uniref:hypothetical protein n=1 Tax=Streptomyces sp. NPDC021100 TaxID=3365114 RepID=UPI0037BB2979
MLLGQWNDEHATLTITETHQIADGDQNAIDTTFQEAHEAGDADWACAFDVDRHSDAVQRAYEEYAREAGLRVVDDVEGHEPVTW